jgi:hypothetical protein
VPENRVAQAVGGGGPDPDDDDLQARLDSLRSQAWIHSHPSSTTSDVDFASLKVVMELFAMGLTSMLVSHENEAAAFMLCTAQCGTPSVSVFPRQTRDLVT